jgi:hypothetical protein
MFVDRRTCRLLALGVAAVAGLGLAVELVYAWRPSELSGSALELLSLSFEANLPTWYASVLMLGCGLAAIDVARLPGAGDVLHWRVLGALFVYISFDEVAEIHERLGGLAGGSGLLYFDWVIPAAFIVAAVGVVFLPFLFRRDPRERRRFVLAGALYVGGALVLELPLGLVAESQETLELAGASLMLASLVDLRSRLRSEAA